MLVGSAFAAPDFFTRATFDPGPVAVILAAGAWYGWELRRLAAKGRKWPAARTACFFAGLLALAVATQSGLAGYRYGFAVHSVQHILIGMAAPVLIALSAPISLTIQAARPETQDRILAAMQGRVARVLFYPAVPWILYGASLFVIYLTGIYPDSIHNALIRELVFLDLLVVGCIFFAPAVAADPLPYPMGFSRRIGWFVLCLPLHTIFGMSLESQTTSLAAHVSVGDIHLGGGLMWVAGEILGLFGALAVFSQWLRADERAALAHDEQAEPARARQLAHWRATRDAAARAASR